MPADDKSRNEIKLQMGSHGSIVRETKFSAKEEKKDSNPSEELNKRGGKLYINFVREKFTKENKMLFRK